MAFDKNRDLFPGQHYKHAKKKKRLEAYRDRQTVDIFLGNTDQEAGRGPVMYDAPMPSVADELGLVVKFPVNKKKGEVNNE